ncbi:MAG TPA: gephyrin-like molybdotransferase Glp [Acidobacteriaceae bacterium]|jgi:molybdopterin molybdotransferase|nr:gephyrin-like molybdotransferase Glp [Acidobacteriaceae bacterium]
MTIPSPSVVLSYEDAATVVSGHAERVRLWLRPTEKVPLLSAAGRVLAEPVLADRDQPPFARSTRDGFACRAAELRAGRLKVAGQLRAGQAWTGGEIRTGEAIEIMTGAVVPPGADCVVMIEHVSVSECWISLAPARELVPGENVVNRGTEARAGDVLVPVGRRIGATEVAAAAFSGNATLAVFSKPRVAILATGDELVEVGDVPLQYQIRNSNSYSLATQATAAGADPRIFPIVPDDPVATERAVGEALQCDLLLMTGGVSMGKFDCVERALLARGADFFFTGARIQPGKPVVFGKLRGPYFFGLPGNPVSTIVTFLLFGAPMLRALAGESESGPHFGSARLSHEVQVRPGLTRFLPARVESDLRGARIRRIAWQGSGDLTAAAQANSFLVVPEASDRLADGDIVSALML